MKRLNSQFSFLNSFSAFTMVELIVGITISMLLMISVSIFVGNGIKNITNQKVIIENDSKIKEFTKSLYESLNAIDKSFLVTNLSSGVLFKVNKTYDKWWFSYIWEKTLDQHYCLSWSESEETNHIDLKTFLPFEWEGSDIFAWLSFSSNWVSSNMFSWTINNLKTLVWPTDVTFWAWNQAYVSDTLGHSIYEFDKTNIGPTIKKIAWKEVFWDEFSDWTVWTGVFLNNPTWLEFATIWWDPYLFISDTLNDRILYLNLADKKIYKLLWREEWLKEPTWIYYDDAMKTLYIANSGKKQILSYSSSWSFEDNTSLSFTPKNNITSINKLEFSFFFDSWVSNPSLTNPTTIWSFSFNPDIKDEDYLTGSLNKLIYYFSDYSTLIRNNYPCSSDWYYFSGAIDSPLKITGCNWSTWSLYKWNLSKTFTAGTNYFIDIGNIAWANFSNVWPYYISLNLLSWSTVKKTYYFPYFSKWDDNLLTKKDNILKTLTWWLWYPTWIYADWSNLVYNDFLKREKTTITKNWNLVSTPSNLTGFDFSNLIINSTNDSVLYTPVKNYDLKFDNTSKLLSIYINYYKNFSCYSDDNKSQVKELILKKSFK